MDKLVQSFITNLVKWTPSGVGIFVTAHELLSDESNVMKAVLAAFLTGCSALWVRFSGKFMEEAGNEAEARGGGLAKWMFAMGDQAVQALQDKSLQAWRNLTSDFESKYYQRLIYSCRNYETQGLDKDRVLKLQKMFVPLKISQKSLATISPALIQALPQTLPEQQEIGALLIWMEQDPAFRRLAILGVPGSGKTTLMRYLTIAYASRKQRKLIDSKVPTYIPVLMYLKDVREDIINNPELPLVALINTWVHRLQKTDPLTPPSGWFSGKLKQNRCLILLDGLDEIADATERQAVSRWVDAQMKEYPDAPFILTSRPLGYQQAKLQQPVTVLEVQPFTLKQVQQFIHSWYVETEIRSQGNTDDLGVRDEANRQADDLIKRIRDSAPLVAMAVNPLLLTMIATVHRRGNALPGKRVELYKEICQVLLEKRQRAKNLTINLTALQSQSVLQGLALTLMLRPTRSFVLSDVEDLLLQRLVLVSRDSANPAHFLTQMREVSGLLVAKEEGLYEFAHLSFQEYLAAVEIGDSNQEQLLINSLQHSEQLSWWSETIRLYAAQNNTSNIIQAAIDCSTVQALSLAFDCLEEGKSVDPPVRAALESILEEGLESL
ncbi:MAG: NACHT domain-containing protein [Cyanobacteria bacterium J06555_13]